MSIKLKVFFNQLNLNKIVGNTLFLDFFEENQCERINKKKDYSQFSFNKIKLFRLIKFILKIKFTIKKPIQKKVLIFDNISHEVLNKFFFNFSVQTIKSRAEYIKELYLYPKIIFIFLKNFFRFPLKINYLIALIETINPKLIVCSVHNSKDFSIISLYFKNRINCVLFRGIVNNDYNNFYKKTYFQKIFYFGKSFKKFNETELIHIPPIEILYFSRFKKRYKKKKKYLQYVLLIKAYHKFHFFGKTFLKKVF